MGRDRHNKIFIIGLMAFALFLCVPVIVKAWRYVTVPHFVSRDVTRVRTLRAAEISALPPYFVNEEVAQVTDAVALAKTPDGRLLIAVRTGTVRIVQDDVLLEQPALDRESVTCYYGESGMLGLAVDPNFITNKFVYVFYTHNGNTDQKVCGDVSGAYSRVSRFVLGDDNLMRGETVLLNYIPASPGGWHAAGDLNIGADGLLYISVGDGRGGLTSTPANLLGKILRINLDGSIPQDNPNAQADGAVRCGQTRAVEQGRVCQETYASGFRNPWQFTFAPDTHQMYANDVGENTWEEVDLVKAGADYGYPTREGPCDYAKSAGCTKTPAQFTDPIYWYGRAEGCSVTGGAFADANVWPAPYANAFFFGDYCRNTIYQLMANGENGYTRSAFFVADTTNVMMFFDSSTASLYYALADGSVNRIRFTGYIAPTEPRCWYLRAWDAWQGPMRCAF